MCNRLAFWEGGGGAVRWRFCIGAKLMGGMMLLVVALGAALGLVTYRSASGALEPGAAVRWAITATGAVLLLGVLGAYVLARSFTQPLRHLLSLTEEFATGDLSRRAGFVCQDEIGMLGAAIDRMAERLQGLLEELQRKEVARKRLIDKLITAQEEERKRVARELHDEIGQRFTSLAVGLRALETMDDVEGVRRCAAELRALAAAAVEDVKHLSAWLRPSVLDDMGLGPALERFVRQFTAKFGLGVELRLEWLECRLPPEVETALYRIVQEAVTNAGRHARAQRVHVLVRREDGMAVVAVRDDGIGFDPQRVCDSRYASAECCLGLMGMRERARMLGGDVSIDSKKGEGTTVRAWIPVPSVGEGNGLGQDQVAAGRRS